MKNFIRFLTFSLAMLVIISITLAGSEKMNKGSSCIDGNKIFDATGLTLVSDASVESAKVSPEICWTGTISTSQAVEAKKAYIEQWAVKEISPQSLNMTMTSDLQVYATKLKARQAGIIAMKQTTQMQEMKQTVQWRNSNLNLSSVTIYGDASGLLIALPRVFPGLNASELSTGTAQNTLCCRDNGDMTNRTAGVPSIWLISSISELSTGAENNSCCNLTALDESIAMPRILLISFNNEATTVSG